MGPIIVALLLIALGIASPVKAFPTSTSSLRAVPTLLPRLGTGMETTTTARGSGDAVLPLAEDFLNAVAILAMTNATLATACGPTCIQFSSAVYNISSTTYVLDNAMVGTYLCGATIWADSCAMCVGVMDVVQAYDMLVMECAQEDLLNVTTTQDIVIPQVTPVSTATNGITIGQTAAGTVPPFASILAGWDISPNNTASGTLAALMSSTVSTGPVITATGIAGNVALAAQGTGSSGTGGNGTSTNTSTNGTSSTTVISKPEPSPSVSAGEMDCPTLLALNATDLQRLNATMNGTDPTALDRAIAICDPSQSTRNAAVTESAGSGSGTNGSIADPNVTGNATESNGTTNATGSTGTEAAVKPDGALRMAIACGCGWVPLMALLAASHWIIGGCG